MSDTFRTRVALARVLLVDDDPTSRLTLQTVLEASGYEVDAAASAAEAVNKLEEQEYQLVLSDLHMESPEAGRKVLAQARMMDYRPATALVNTQKSRNWRNWRNADSHLRVEFEDLEGLLTTVADLISERATRRLRRELRHAGA